MNPADFLNLANELMCSTDEAKRRTAISRAYYYTYHYIKQILVKPEIYLDHTHVVECIQQARIAGKTVEDFEILAENIGHLKSDRKFADYDIHEPLNQETCNTMIKRCQAVVADFKNCKKRGLIKAARHHLTYVRKIRI